MGHNCTYLRFVELDVLKPLSVDFFVKRNIFISAVVRMFDKTLLTETSLSNKSDVYGKYLRN